MKTILTIWGRLENLSIFQKINYYLIFFLFLSVIFILLGGIVDVNERYISNSWDGKSESKTLMFLAMSAIFQVVFILPNTFTIYVHEMKRQIYPPIPKWYNRTKNICILILLGVIFVPMLIYPFLTSSNPGDAELITKFLIEKIHSNIKSGNEDLFFFVFLAAFLLPIVGIINWLHAMVWKGYTFIICKK